MGDGGPVEEEKDVIQSASYEVCGEWLWQDVDGWLTLKYGVVSLTWRQRGMEVWT